LSVESTSSIIEGIRLNSIIKPMFKVRTIPRDIEALAFSIAEEGLLQPLIVRPKCGKFELVSGSRRLEACRLLGWRKVPCQVVELTDQEAFEVALAENIARETLDPLDEAKAFEEYVRRYGRGSQAELARKIGKSPSFISRRLSLLKLPEENLKELLRRRNNPSSITELLAVHDQELRTQLTDLSLDGSLSIKEIRRIRHRLQDSKMENEWLPSQTSAEFRQNRKIKYAIRKIIVALKLALHRVDDVIDNLDQRDWILREILMQQRQSLHSQIDLVCNLIKKIENRLIAFD
jgi:ParB family chromosome partitioning protein